jgi:2,3-bisphosphoglycerate-independent phosphoglycerate mutase
LLITSDHGNAEQMDDPSTGQPHTAHTMNRVPVLLANAPAWVTGLSDGRLADIAPTLLQLMNLPVPTEMTGRTLIRANPRAAANKPAEAAAE